MLPRSESRSGSLSENASTSGRNAASDRRGGEESIEDGGINSARLFREPSPSLWQRASGVITTISSFIYGRDSNITRVSPEVSDIIVDQQNNQDDPSSPQGESEGESEEESGSSSSSSSSSSISRRVWRRTRTPGRVRPVVDDESASGSSSRREYHVVERITGKVWRVVHRDSSSSEDER